MPADAGEVEDALAEGVQMRWLSTITQVEGTTLTLEKMRLDDDGRPQPTGEYEELSGDAVVLALGQDIDQSLLTSLPGVTVRDGVVEVGPGQMTGAPGVFAGGDVAPAQRSVTAAIGQGRTAAQGIDAWFRSAAPATERDAAEPVPFDKLNTWYYSDAPHAVRPRLDAARRTADFSEIVGGLDADTALYEARRCLSCGNCFGCDNCYGVCPDNAVLKIVGAHGAVDPSAYGYAIDLDYCKGCGLCVSECPAGAIVMIPEQT
jgi:Pyruvate/2-oxoacid:ferredoxin oxidoreductase delta subunit